MSTLSPTAPARGLAALPEVALNERHQRMLDAALAQAGGPPVWRARKRAEARDLLALSQIAPRLRVDFLDLREAFRAVLWLKVPVPLQPDEQGQLRLAGHAVLGLMYPQEALRQPLPGYAFVRILAPGPVWLANVAPVIDQPLCLGAHLPSGGMLRVKEIVLMSYGALSMQTVMVDQYDAAGVMHVEAARWWQQHTDAIPLSRTPFLGTDDLKGNEPWF